jgi:NADPH:quinone reductase-like Zn-dependent oxidoreductase
MVRTNPFLPLGSQVNRWAAVGSKILNFRVGDRVISLNHSSGFAEYGVGPAHTTAHIPDNVTFEGIYIRYSF